MHSNFFISKENCKLYLSLIYGGSPDDYNLVPAMGFQLVNPVLAPWTQGNFVGQITVTSTGNVQDAPSLGITLLPATAVVRHYNQASQIGAIENGNGVASMGAAAGVIAVSFQGWKWSR